MIKLDYTGCGHAPLWMRQDSERLLTLEVDLPEFTCPENDREFFARLVGSFIHIPIRVGDYRNLEFACDEARKLKHRNPSLAHPEIRFTFQNRQVSFRTYDESWGSFYDIEAFVTAVCSELYTELRFTLCDRCIKLQLRPLLDEFQLGGKSDVFRSFYAYLKDANTFSDACGKFYELRMPNLQTIEVCMEGSPSVVLNPENITNALSSSHGDKKYVQVEYEDNKIIKVLKLYLNTRESKY